MIQVAWKHTMWSISIPRYVNLFSELLMTMQPCWFLSTNGQQRKGWLMWWMTTEKGWIMWSWTKEKRLAHVMTDNRKKVESCDHGQKKQGWLMWWMTTEKRLNHVIIDNRKKIDSCDNGHLWDTCQQHCRWPFWHTLPTQNASTHGCGPNSWLSNADF